MYGARPLKRTISAPVLDALATACWKATSAKAIA